MHVKQYPILSCVLFMFAKLAHAVHNEQLRAHGDVLKQHTCFYIYQFCALLTLIM